MRVTAARLVRHGQPLEVQEIELARPGDQETVNHGRGNPGRTEQRREANED